MFASICIIFLVCIYHKFTSLDSSYTNAEVVLELKQPDFYKRFYRAHSGQTWRSHGLNEGVSA